jgi:hypothetical protein
MANAPDEDHTHHLTVGPLSLAPIDAGAFAPATVRPARRPKGASRTWRPSYLLVFESGSVGAHVLAAFVALDRGALA